ncbi:unnamed protein product [Leptidea sinapis]|uniref:PiggyBac transposable element-derived protein domain-containing protein n=1 Tax=Leptidea sinapis TaxID=189913 RepID=A0A5E4QUW5_9NEOP|nr:unnamed protein product [Leptidea sinapis]
MDCEKFIKQECEMRIEETQHEIPESYDMLEHNTFVDSQMKKEIFQDATHIKQDNEIDIVKNELPESYNISEHNMDVESQLNKENIQDGGTYIMQEHEIDIVKNELPDMSDGEYLVPRPSSLFLALTRPSGTPYPTGSPATVRAGPSTSRVQEKRPQIMTSSTGGRRILKARRSLPLQEIMEKHEGDSCNSLRGRGRRRGKKQAPGPSGLISRVEQTIGTSSSSRRRRTLKAPLSQPLQDDPKRQKVVISVDSDSEGESDAILSDDEYEEALCEDYVPRNIMNRLRQDIIMSEEGDELEVNVTDESDDEFGMEDIVMESDERVMHDEAMVMLEEDTNVLGGLIEPDVSDIFQWTDDFSSFTGKPETYQRNPGPAFISDDPAEIFLKIWDEDIMGLIASETNSYARHHIEQFRNPDIGSTLPKYLEKWVNVTIQVLYQFYAMLIFMSFCSRAKFQQYWERGMLEMPNFRQTMSRDKFMLITKFLHFVSDMNGSVHGNARKIGKIAPILDHCNKKFSELYIPTQHLSLDESFLLWKGNLSGRQCMRSKAARFGIKSFELCEATTGYLLNYKLYTGKDMSTHPKPVHGFANSTAKVVLELMDGYLDVGHHLVMDNWYNQLVLTRYLKSRRTDVLGTISRKRKYIPQDLKDLKQNQVARGDSIARHCGDIALVTWKDVKLVTVVSTYHQHQMVPVIRAGVPMEKPIAVQEYNQYMGGVDLKDQKLSMFPFERKTCLKWYIKVFRRLFNTSLLNAYIIYTKGPLHRLCSHREFRQKVAEGLLARFGSNKVHNPLPVLPTSHNQILRLQPGDHFPTSTDLLPGNSTKRRRMNCARCKHLKKRSQVRTMCSLCQAPLCIGKCWSDYHTLENLKT